MALPGVTDQLALVNYGLHDYGTTDY